MLAALRSWCTAALDRLEARQQLVPPPADWPPPPSPWLPGDIAFCAEEVDWRAFQTPAGRIIRGPWIGATLRVERVLEHDGDVYLAFESFPGVSYRARHFRRLHDRAAAPGAASPAATAQMESAS